LKNLFSQILGILHASILSVNYRSLPRQASAGSSDPSPICCRQRA
jgi:hypothetical protein